MAARVVVVLGYSEGGHRALHPICAARLVRAAELATADDVVVLSGWSRDGIAEPEATLMRRAWAGHAASVVVDPVARTTAENAVNARDDVLRHGARDVLVVTSEWHVARARAAFRLALLGSGVRVTVVGAPGRRSPRRPALELGLRGLLPFQVAAARVRARRARR